LPLYTAPLVLLPPVRAETRTLRDPSPPGTNIAPDILSLSRRRQTGGLIHRQLRAEKKDEAAGELASPSTIIRRVSTTRSAILKPKRAKRV
jgi:hypothetical protein